MPTSARDLAGEILSFLATALSTYQRGDEGIAPYAEDAPMSFYVNPEACGRAMREFWKEFDLTE